MRASKCAHDSSAPHATSEHLSAMQFEAPEHTILKSLLRAGTGLHTQAGKALAAEETANISRLSKEEALPHGTKLYQPVQALQVHSQCMRMINQSGDQLALGVAREKKVRPKPSYRESSLYATRLGSRNRFASGNGTLSQKRRPFSGTPAHRRLVSEGCRFCRCSSAWAAMGMRVPRPCNTTLRVPASSEH